MQNSVSIILCTVHDAGVILRSRFALHPDTVSDLSSINFWDQVSCVNCSKELHFGNGLEPQRECREDKKTEPQIMILEIMI